MASKKKVDFRTEGPAPQARGLVEPRAKQVLRGPRIRDPRARCVCDDLHPEGDERIIEYVGELIDKEESERRGVSQHAKSLEDRRCGGVYLHAVRKLRHRRQRAMEHRAADQPLLRAELRGVDRGAADLHPRAARHQRRRGADLRLWLRRRLLRGSSVPLRQGRMRRLHRQPRAVAGT